MYGVPESRSEAAVGVVVQGSVLSKLKNGCGKRSINPKFQSGGYLRLIINHLTSQAHNFVYTY